MNLKIESDRLEGAGALHKTPATTTARHAYGAAPAGDSYDSANISDLTLKVSEVLSSEQARIENRVSELAALYAKGEYNPDAKSLSRALVSRALSSTGETGL